MTAPATATLAPPLPPPKAPAATGASTPDGPAARLRSLDILRGIACVLMAIDHVRVYSGLPAGGPTAGIFLTRWVTHFVAPAFCFLAGAGVYFLARRLADHGAVRRFLVTRGLLLVLLELTFIRVLWAFSWSPDFMLAGVIWMLGWCMVLLAAFVGMPAARVGAIGVAVIVLQPLFGALGNALPAAIKPVFAFLYPSGSDALLGINVLYVIVPWIGVMMAGFGFGVILDRPDALRRKQSMRLGAMLTAAFLVIASIVTLYARSDTGAADGLDDRVVRAAWMAVLDQRKYPASPLFLLMTLGPLILLVPWAERAQGWLVTMCETFGRVPMWYYLKHLLVIHVAAIVVMWIRTGAPHREWFSTAPYTSVPEEARWPLWLLYVVWAVCIALLYPLCAAYAERKRTRPSPWMRYL